MKFVYNEIKDFKSYSEDGWELFEQNDSNPIMNIQRSDFYSFIKQIFENIMKSYEERNLLEFFFKYYGNYFFLTLQPEFVVNMTAFAKMILYAYTLEEKDFNKNLYCIMNDDLRSKDQYKISRYIDIIKLIGGLVKEKRLKCFTGNLYRASFLKDELIKKIKIGQSLTNAAFWSSTKSELVAKKFLSSNYKNAMIIIKGGLENNVDIHLEGISRYPKEQEVLFLPFCKFIIKNFVKINEKNKTYYKLIIESDSNSSTIEPLFNFVLKKLNYEIDY